MTGVVDGIEYRQDSTARVTKYVLYAMAKHHFMEYLASRQADKRMIKSCVGLRFQRYRKWNIVPGRKLLESWPWILSIDMKGVSYMVSDC